MRHAHFPDDIRIENPTAPWNERGTIGECEHCGRVIWESDENTATRVAGVIVCSECIDNGVVICPSCGRTFETAADNVPEEHLPECEVTR
jgi:transcription elongation factor Elf1